MSYAFGSPGRQLHGDLPGSGNWRNMEVHVGFKFSRADMLTGVDPYRQGLYYAYIARTFEQAYEWTERHDSLTAWNEHLFKPLQLPEVNVVVSGRANHPILPSKFGATLGPWIDQMLEHPIRVSGDMDILKRMQPDKTDIVIQGDALHPPKHIIAINGAESFDTAIKEARDNLMLRAVRLSRLQEVQALHPEVAPDAMAYWNGLMLNAHDARGSQLSMHRISQAYNDVYTRLKHENPNLTVDQLKYGAAVETAGQYHEATIFNSETQVYCEIMEEAIAGLENANREAHYAQLAPNAVLINILQQLPQEAQKPFEDAWGTRHAEVLEQYPGASAQANALTAATRALQDVAELVPQDLRYQLFHDTDMESRFVDAMEGREHEAITPFD